MYMARPLSLPRPPRFRWHYDPPHDPPDPPSIVVAAPRSSTLPTDLNSQSKGSPASPKYMVVRGKGEEGTSLLARIRGAVAALTATCLPLRVTLGHTSLLSHQPQPHAAPEPEFPPDHLLSQESKHLNSPIVDASCGASQCNTARSRHAAGDGRAGEGGHSLPGLSPDPTLVGYVCSLPDDDDHTPYTAAHPPVVTHVPVAASTPFAPPTATHTPMHVHVALINSETTAHMATEVEPPQVGPTPQCIPPPAALPTPLPTPTITDGTKTVSTTFPLPAPPQPCPPTPARHHDASSATSEPDSTTDALDTPREEQPLLQEQKFLESEIESEEMFSSVLSTKSEVRQCQLLSAHPLLTVITISRNIKDDAFFPVQVHT